MIHLLYSGLGIGLHLILSLLRKLIEALGGRFAYGLGQRLGNYPPELDRSGEQGRLLWLHASSVGEIQAAILLVEELQRTNPDLRLVLTSMTEQGNRLARARLPQSVACLMAPLDLAPAVRRALRTLRPDLYVCLETELWPVMLTEARRAGVPMLLLNGRLSQRSFGRYQHIGRYIAALLAGFHTLAVIGEADGRRFAALGVPEGRIRVCGNIKYDMPADNPEAVRRRSRERLGVTDEIVLLCGSTHEGEEAQLLPVVDRMAAEGPAVLVIAPRHLQRLPAIRDALARAGAACALFSQLPQGGGAARVILVDTMGDLAELYAGGDYLFCGGSLVDRGGHNVIEAARWGRPVCFGPHMKDFRDAAELLVEAGGGFQVADASVLADRILALMHDPESYRLACERAAAAAARQRGALLRQADLVRDMLAALP